MNKSLLWIVVVIIVVGGAIWLWPTNDTNTNTTTNQTTNTATDAMTQQESLTDLFASGDTVMCDYSYQDDYGTQSGTVYVDEDQVRGDFTMVSSNGTITSSHIIRDAVYHYTWGTYNGVTTGTKIKLSDFTPTDQTVEDDTTEESTAPTLDYDYTYDFDCDNWSADSSKFDVPTDVEFTDLTEQMEQLEALTNQTLTDQCATCDAMTDTTLRDACREGLGC